MNHDTAALLILVCIALAVLSRWHMSKATDFDLRWLTVDGTTGKVSLYKFCQLGAFFFSSWVLVHETRAGKLNEWLFGSYMIAWAGANIANKFAEAKKANTP